MTDKRREVRGTRKFPVFKEISMTYQFCDYGKDVEKTRFAISTGQTIDAIMFLVPKAQ